MLQDHAGIVVVKAKRYINIDLHLVKRKYLMHGLNVCSIKGVPGERGEKGADGHRGSVVRIVYFSNI